MKCQFTNGKLPNNCDAIDYLVPPDCINKEELKDALYNLIGAHNSDCLIVEDVERSVLKAYLLALDAYCQQLSEETMELAEAHGVGRIWFFPKMIFCFDEHDKAQAFALWAETLPAEDICLSKMSCQIDGRGVVHIPSPSEVGCQW